MRSPEHSLAEIKIRIPKSQQNPCKTEREYAVYFQSIAGSFGCFVLTFTVAAEVRQLEPSQKVAGLEMGLRRKIRARGGRRRIWAGGARLADCRLQSNAPTQCPVMPHMLGPRPAPAPDHGTAEFRRAECSPMDNFWVGDLAQDAVNACINCRNQLGHRNPFCDHEACWRYFL